MDIKSTCKYCGHVFEGELTQELIRDIKNHEKTCLSNPEDVINRLEELIRKNIEDSHNLLPDLIRRLRQFGLEPEKDMERLKLAKEIIAEQKIPENVHTCGRFLKLCIPFQCFDTCTRSRYENAIIDAKYELFPGKRFVLLMADAKYLQDDRYGWIIE